jgi:hypothetical protein
VRKSETLWPLTVAAGALGAVAAMMLAPSAMADPDAPALPGPALPGPALPGPALPGPADQSVVAQAAPGDPVDPAAPADPAAPPAPPAEVQHLSSPQNLPPGYTLDPAPDQSQSRTGSYLRDLFHAYQTQEIDGKGALLLLTQRPLDPNSMATNGMPNGPQAPPGTPMPQGAPAPDALPADAPAPGPAPGPGPGPGPVLPLMPGPSADAPPSP